ncbi:MAG TPA: hypothetical protein VN231_08740, partial [Allosphingosinicella sp.]|nr:hypothetical protein [Allosphingosinicella sp.]
DAPRKGEERVLPLRSFRAGEGAAELAPVQAAAEPLRDHALERRVAGLESRLEEQERALRRVLTLLVDWVEAEQESLSYRHNAA